MLSEWDILLWAILGLLLINHLRLNFLLRQVIMQNQTLIGIFVTQLGTMFGFQIPESDIQFMVNSDGGFENINQKSNSEQIKEWDEGN